MEELETLERFQPTDSNIKVGNLSSLDYYVRSLYRPKENIEHIYQLTTLAFIMSCSRISVSLFESEHFEKTLLKDLKYYLKEV